MIDRGVYTVTCRATPPRCSCGWALPSSILSALPSDLSSSSFRVSVQFTAATCPFHHFTSLSRPVCFLKAMASRPAAGARPGAKFAQFKLVLLGELSPHWNGFLG